MRTFTIRVHPSTAVTVTVSGTWAFSIVFYFEFNIRVNSTISDDKGVAFPKTGIILRTESAIPIRVQNLVRVIYTNSTYLC